MRHGSVLLQTSAVLSWGMTITADALNADDRVWLPLFGAAMVASMAALMDQMERRSARAYAAAMQAGISRPPYAGPPSGPLAKLVTTGPLAKLVPFPGNGSGRHATPRR